MYSLSKNVILDRKQVNISKKRQCIPLFWLVITSRPNIIKQIPKCSTFLELSFCTNIVYIFNLEPLGQFGSILRILKGHPEHLNAKNKQN